MKKIELLAPAGSIEALTAAVENGADAVYLGGSLFSARQYAANFNVDEIAEAVDYSHKRGVRIYTAVNTLINNDEINDLINYIFKLGEKGIDAIIVQDLGAAHLINKVLPEMNLHASTQMAIHNSEGINFLEKMGFSRVVLAREVSLENIKLIKKNAQLELETFIHGALCISYSGQCFMSSMIGGRSGNRGRCAQPCRMKYTLVDNNKKTLVDSKTVGEHLLSPKDLNMIEYIPQLISAGISSLKIEGRMKRPEYVAVVVKNYRKAIDDYYNKNENDINLQMKRELTQIFNREFTTGYYFNNQSRDMMSYKRPNNRGMLLGRVTKAKLNFMTIKLQEPLTIGDGFEIWVTKGGRIAGEVKEMYLNGERIQNAASGQEVSIKINGKPKIGDRVFKNLDAELIRTARESFTSPKVNRKTPLKIEIIVKEGKAIEMKAQDIEDNKVLLQGDFIVEKAEKRPINREIIFNQLSRLGNTPFYLAELTADIRGDLMVPMSELNQLRRQIVEAILMEKKKKFHTFSKNKDAYLKETTALYKKIPEQKVETKKPLLSVLVGTPGAVKETVLSGADQLYINWEGLKNKKSFTLEKVAESIAFCQKHKKKIFLRLPRIISENNLNIQKKLLEKLCRMDFDGVMVGNLGTLQLIKHYGFKNVFADYTLNVFNDLAVQKLIEEEISQVTLSPELTLEQIKDFRYKGRIPMEVIVHGNFPLMMSEHCVIGSLLGQKTTKQNCQGPCKNDGYGLLDRMNFVFPLAMDEKCRMLVYNAKSLSLYKDLNLILKTGINSIRIEGRKENENWLARVTTIYRRAIDSWFENKEFFPEEKMLKQLESLEPGGYTTGHYFRGVE